MKKYLIAALSLLCGCHEKTHTYELEYSIGGERQSPMIFRATQYWDYSDSVEWMDDNNSDLNEADRDRNEANGNGTLGRTGTIDKGYVLRLIK